jgi:hypothetical protein
MANRHFAKLGDIWKHLPLGEILSLETPRLYWESHAGSAAYAVVDDAERRFGVLRFREVAGRSEKLAASRYLHELHHFNSRDRLRIYPGSPLLAMSELASGTTYTFCDLDPESQGDLHTWADRLGLTGNVTVVDVDGITTLHEALADIDPTELLVHIDPFDPWKRGPAGLSAVDLAVEIAECGARLVYWYGYDRPQERAWALGAIGAKTTTALWCGDIMVVAAIGPATSDDGDLGLATTPGTGCGIVCANLAQSTRHACGALGEALAAAYRHSPLPDCTSGGLEFLSP